MSERQASSDHGEDPHADSRGTALTDECNVAQQAVSGASGRNLPKSMDNLAKAYQHSKTCEKCSETLGGFLADLITQLGVKLPRPKSQATQRSAEFSGRPSEVTSKSASGPGTVGYDPKTSDQGYELKATVSTLALTVENLSDKCRVKDHMIEMMADELRRLGQKLNWSGTDLIADISDQPTEDTIDFNRKALCSYLHQEPVHSFQTEEEVEGREEYRATNPLGLTIVRQVGPDSILIKWSAPPPSAKVYAFEVFVNGMFLQRIRSPGRTKTLIHPINLSEKIFITLNSIAYEGDTTGEATVTYGPPPSLC